jgi:hypothetical protein
LFQDLHHSAEDGLVGSHLKGGVRGWGGMRSGGGGGVGRVSLVATTTAVPDPHVDVERLEQCVGALRDEPHDAVPHHNHSERLERDEHSVATDENGGLLLGGVESVETTEISRLNPSHTIHGTSMRADLTTLLLSEKEEKEEDEEVECRREGTSSRSLGEAHGSDLRSRCRR